MSEEQTRRRFLAAAATGIASLAYVELPLAFEVIERAPIEGIAKVGTFGAPD